MGNSLAAQDKQLLNKNCISNILICGSELQKSFPCEFRYHKINIEDNEQENILNYLDESIEFIK